MTPLTVVCDSREQLPYRFDRWAGVRIFRGTLPTGDYSLAGYEDRLAVERKSLEDLLGCLTFGRERFERELRRAGDLGLDFAVLGSVLPTPSHPGGPTLGWPGAAELLQDCRLPVYLIGGLGHGDLPAARAAGAQGIAAIRAAWAGD